VDLRRTCEGGKEKKTEPSRSCTAMVVQISPFQNEGESGSGGFVSVVVQGVFVMCCQGFEGSGISHSSVWMDDIRLGWGQWR
jgi:hypothetical protein